MINTLPFFWESIHRLGKESLWPNKFAREIEAHGKLYFTVAKISHRIPLLH